MTKHGRDIATQYNVVIAALVPFAARGKLSVGLNKLKSRINKNDLEEIRYEVNRLITPSTEEVDNSEFAKGTGFNIKVDDINLCLDAVGKRILKEELDRHNNSYTQGVCEAIQSPVRYDKQVEKENLKQRLEAFSVDCIKGHSELPLDKIKLVPNFSVRCLNLEDNEPLPLHYISSNEVAVELKGKPKLKKGDSLCFNFPALDNLTEEPYSTDYHCTAVNALPARNTFLAIFQIETDEPWSKLIESYILLNFDECPLVAEQEEGRTERQLLKDTIVSNMPICATLCEQQQGKLIPHTVLRSLGNQDQATSQSQPPCFDKSVFARLSKEFTRTRETYQFSLTRDINGVEQTCVANLGELLRDKTLGIFIDKGLSNSSLKVIKLSLISVFDEQLANVVSSAKSVLPELKRYKYIIYSTDVTSELNNFSVYKAAKTTSLGNNYVLSKDSHYVESCVPNHQNLRTEPRFKFDAEVLLKSNWFKSINGNIMDISSRGLRVKIADISYKTKDHINASIPALELTNIKYNVVSHDQNAGIIHLEMADSSAEKHAERLAKILDHNAVHFDPSGFHQIKEPLFDYMWSLVSKSVPGIHILLGRGKSAKQQLIVAQTDGEQKSLAPFKLADNRLPTHGWFANKNSADLHSERLNEFMQENASPQTAMFFINRKAGRYSSLEDGALDNENTRTKMRSAIASKKGKLVAHTMQANNYCKLDDSWYRKRCEHLKMVNKPAIQKIRKQESSFARILSIIPVSMLHQFLLPLGEFDSSSKPDAS